MCGTTGTPHTALKMPVCDDHLAVNLLGERPSGGLQRGVCIPAGTRSSRRHSGSEPGRRPYDDPSGGLATPARVKQRSALETATPRRAARGPAGGNLASEHTAEAATRDPGEGETEQRPHDGHSPAVRRARPATARASAASTRTPPGRGGAAARGTADGKPGRHQGRRAAPGRPRRRPAADTTPRHGRQTRDGEARRTAGTASSTRRRQRPSTRRGGQHTRRGGGELPPQHEQQAAAAPALACRRPGSGGAAARRPRPRGRGQRAEAVRQATGSRAAGRTADARGPRPRGGRERRRPYGQRPARGGRTADAWRPGLDTERRHQR